MEVDNANPPEINRTTSSTRGEKFSFHMNQKLLINVVDLNKKRKLRAEQLGLPVAKHKCSDGSLPSKSPSTFDENPVEDFPAYMMKEIAEAGATSDESERESGKDSNGFQEDSDAAMSVYGESKFEADNVKSWLYDSSSSSYLGTSSSKDTCNSSDGTAVAGGVDKEHHPIHQLDGSHIAEDLDEPLIEYGEHVGYLCSGYGKDSIEQYMDKDVEDVFHADEANPNIYVLSSGRWGSNQDAQQGKRKPTIDQEFEQYFSTLML